MYDVGTAGWVPVYGRAGYYVGTYGDFEGQVWKMAAYYGVCTWYDSHQVIVVYLLRTPYISTYYVLSLRERSEDVHSPDWGLRSASGSGGYTAVSDIRSLCCLSRAGGRIRTRDLPSLHRHRSQVPTCTYLK